MKFLHASPLTIVLKLTAAVLWALSPSADAAATANNSSTAAISKSEVEAAAHPSEFVFKGGSFRQLVNELRSYFGTNELQLLEIPPNAGALNIPKMRIPDAYHGRKDIDPAAARIANLRSLFLVYNRISESGDWFLGKWIFDSHSGPTPPPPPRMIVFSPPKSVQSDADKFTVRAYSLRGVPAEDKRMLLIMIEEESAIMRQEFEQVGGAVAPNGYSRIHPTTELLVAKGGKIYIDLVTAIVEAYLAGGVPAAKPNR